MLRADVDEVDVESVDLGLELRDRVQLGLALAPVILGDPVARECLHRRRLHALGRIVHELALGPGRRSDATAQIVEVLLCDIDLEGTDFGGSLDGDAHV